MGRFSFAYAWMFFVLFFGKTGNYCVLAVLLIHFEISFVDAPEENLSPVLLSKTKHFFRIHMPVS